MSTFFAAFLGGFVSYAFVFGLSWLLLVWRDRRSKKRWLAARERILSMLQPTPVQNAPAPKLGEIN